ncbi:hypothetical protein BCR35DRAFT_213892 [Leucosporidium creatinivorum]|uniref:Uncharacterized protein n=1 Tax=Leucosporidium creatinivorum TaxID=106004 RepID=A0A1Y2DBN9_9BASI|nr:hypothetical protein BCR35DRAFT_213892 [Leucosporidium creatinivorum]
MSYQPPPSTPPPSSAARRNNNPFASPPPRERLSPTNPFAGSNGSFGNAQNEGWSGQGVPWSGNEGLAEGSSRPVLSEWGLGEGEGANPWGDVGGGSVAGGYAVATPASGGDATSSGQSTLAGTPSIRYTTPSPNGQLPPGAAPSAYTPSQPAPGPPLPRRPPPSSASASQPPILPPRNSSLLPEVQSTSTNSIRSPSESSNDLFSRSRFAKGKGVATPEAESPAPRPPSQPSATRNGASEPPEFTSFDLATRSIIREAMDELIKFHKDELFLHRLQAPPLSSPPQPLPSPPTGSRPDGATLDHDAATESFINAFPSLSRSPSPVPGGGAPHPWTSASASSLAPTSGFEEKTHRMTGLLLWQLKSLVDEEVARGEQGWREEKRRGMQEVEEMERELSDEAEGRRKAEEEVKTLKAANQALESQIQDSSASHNLDLEAAARASTELSERVEILQQALNDQDHAQDARIAAGADEGDNVWSAIVDSQSEVSKASSELTRRGV